MVTLLTTDILITEDNILFLLHILTLPAWPVPHPVFREQVLPCERAHGRCTFVREPEARKKGGTRQGKLPLLRHAKRNRKQYLRNMLQEHT